MSVEQVRRMQQVVKVSSEDVQGAKEASKARTAAAAAEKRSAKLDDAVGTQGAAAPSPVEHTRPPAEGQPAPPLQSSAPAQESHGVEPRGAGSRGGEPQRPEASSSPTHQAAAQSVASTPAVQREPAPAGPTAATPAARPTASASDMPWLIDEEAAAIENAQKAAQQVEADARAASEAAAAAEQKAAADTKKAAAEARRPAAAPSERPGQARPAPAQQQAARAPVDEVEVTPLGEVPDRGAKTRTMAEIRSSLGDCTRCALSESRTHLVFGEGDPDARLMIVGEAPSRLDDARGRLFSDEAGELLTAMLRAMGLSREQVYTTSILKCRPPNNRAGERDELMACARFLRPQIETVQPEVILTLGSEASRLLLGSTFEFSSRRGEWGAWEQVPVMPTWHPGYLVHHPAEKRSAWADLQLVMERLGLRG